MNTIKKQIDKLGLVMSHVLCKHNITKETYYRDMRMKNPQVIPAHRLQIYADLIGVTTHDLLSGLTVFKKAKKAMF